MAIHVWVEVKINEDGRDYFLTAMSHFGAISFKLPKIKKLVKTTITNLR